MRRFVIACEHGDYHTATPVTLVEGTEDWPGLDAATVEIATHQFEAHGAPGEDGVQMILREVTEFDGALWVTEAATSSAGAASEGGEGETAPLPTHCQDCGERISNSMALTRWCKHCDYKRFEEQLGRESE